MKRTPDNIVKQLKKVKTVNKSIVFSYGDFRTGTHVFNLTDANFQDDVAEFLMSMSLSHRISYVGKDNGGLWIPLVKSNDGTTNITADVIQAFFDLTDKSKHN